ncbi:Asp23/Gls24 family envelope stress response protein [Periweissella beninensis]|uniref:Stress response regulator gls24 homolog n=1 Tax=Periweissella beninensis TaxID=504936 RepID=A0ABT0VHE3_9LACO|nr:Asp23/Gls24 family envelope stress response protein [Periweissella beninensis]MBM7544495.1 putative alkaline shock family protein YloU [Periweissella beninensis]MCM2437030.1 Asp23/Gls24 family envelope stress response protein [Periweissella beninensis]MCT4395793.1 Asp23/Gls24 family envelope stress response protein [Periweissella beninensis]
MVTINNTTTKKEDTTKQIKGELSYDDKVIQKIVGISLEGTQGLLSIDGGLISNIKNKLVNSDNPTEGVDVEVGKEQVAVDLNIVAEYGADIRKLYDEIKATIAKQVEKMTGLNVVETNVRVVDIQSKTEFEEGNVSLQDRAGDLGNSVKNATSNGVKKVQNTVSSDDDDKASRVK